MGKRTYTYDGSEWVGLTSTTADLSNYANMTTTPISGFRNVIINGDFRINQRGLGSAGTVYTSGYGFDRWYVEANNGTLTHSAQTFTPGNAIAGYEPISFARLTTSGQTLSGAYAALIQKIEDVRSLAGQTITISFWAKAASGTPKIAIEMDQNFGSGGSTRVTTLAGQVTLSTLWNRYSVTVQVPSISGKTIGSSSFIALDLFTSAGADFNVRSGSLGIQNNTFDFWGVQVESGTIATPLEQRPIGLELSLCQRYFVRLNDPAGSGTGTGSTTGGCSRTNFALPVEMRIVPTSVTMSGTFAFWNGQTASTGTSFNQTFRSKTSVEVDFNTSIAYGIANAVKVYTNSGNGANWLDISAEL
jgi:hypothetical protein